jgi:hypothetical protein
MRTGWVGSNTVVNEKVIRMAGAKFLRAKVVGNFILEVQITFHVFDLGKF